MADNARNTTARSADISLEKQNNRLSYAFLPVLFLKSQKFEIPDFYWLCAFVFFFHDSIINQFLYRMRYITMQTDTFSEVR